MTNNVVVLTAINIEYQAVRTKLVSPTLHHHEKGTLFEVGSLPGATCTVALGLTGKGNQSSAALVERAIGQFSPVAVLFVGVAGALWDTTRLGDVVVATHVYAYQGGTSEDDGLKSRPRAWEAEHGIIQLATHLDRVGDWTAGLPTTPRTPKVHFGSIAAGEIVQNSRISGEATWLRDRYNDALAIDMEGAGAAQAGHLSGVPVAIIRGISDMADGTKATIGDRTWQPRAAANAAAFAVRLAAELTNGRAQMRKFADDRAQAGGSVTNTAFGQVGIQGGTVTGSTVWMGAPSGPSAVSELAVALAALRRDLDRERANGMLDDATHKAARAELDIAGRTLKANSPYDRSVFVLALRRLWGLIADTADLAAKVTAVIAAVKGSS